VNKYFHIQLYNSFNMIDVRTAIAGLYLWLLFGFLSSIVSCDIKRLMTHNIFFRHIVGIIAFFLLFTVIDTDNDSSVLNIWIKTMYIYFIFLLMTKSKWYFSIPVLLLMVVDQSLKFQIKFEEKRKTNGSTMMLYENIRDKLNICIIAIIIIGFIHYAIRQYNEYGSKFSLVKLILHHTCRNI
jgi:hypothetical protein